MSKFVMVTAVDDGNTVIVGDEDGQLQAMTAREFLTFTQAGLESTSLKVVPIEIGNKATPLPVSGPEDEVQLDTFTFKTTLATVVAGYSKRTKTWLIGVRTPEPF
jgi:hypothetical protein